MKRFFWAGGGGAPEADDEIEYWNPDSGATTSAEPTELESVSMAKAMAGSLRHMLEVPFTSEPHDSRSRGSMSRDQPHSSRLDGEGSASPRSSSKTIMSMIQRLSLRKVSLGRGTAPSTATGSVLEAAASASQVDFNGLDSPDGDVACSRPLRRVASAIPERDREQEHSDEPLHLQHRSLPPVETNGASGTISPQAWTPPEQQPYQPQYHPAIPPFQDSLHTGDPVVANAAASSNSLPAAGDSRGSRQQANHGGSQQAAARGGGGSRRLSQVLVPPAGQLPEGTVRVSPSMHLLLQLRDELTALKQMQQVQSEARRSSRSTSAASSAAPAGAASRAAPPPPLPVTNGGRQQPQQQVQAQQQGTPGQASADGEIRELSFNSGMAMPWGDVALRPKLDGDRSSTGAASASAQVEGQLPQGDTSSAVTSGDHASEGGAVTHATAGAGALPLHPAKSQVDSVSDQQPAGDHAADGTPGLVGGSSKAQPMHPTAVQTAEAPMNGGPHQVIAPDASASNPPGLPRPAATDSSTVERTPAPSLQGQLQQEPATSTSTSAKVEAAAPALVTGSAAVALEKLGAVSAFNDFYPDNRAAATPITKADQHDSPVLTGHGGDEEQHQPVMTGDLPYDDGGSGVALDIRAQEEGGGSTRENPLLLFHGEISDGDMQEDKGDLLPEAHSEPLGAGVLDGLHPGSEGELRASPALGMGQEAEEQGGAGGSSERRAGARGSVDWLQQGYSEQLEDDGGEEGGGVRYLPNDRRPGMHRSLVTSLQQLSHKLTLRKSGVFSGLRTAPSSPKTPQHQSTLALDGTDAENSRYKSSQSCVQPLDRALTGDSSASNEHSPAIRAATEQPSSFSNQRSPSGSALKSSSTSSRPRTQLHVSFLPVSKDGAYSSAPNSSPPSPMPSSPGSRLKMTHLLETSRRSMDRLYSAVRSAGFSKAPSNLGSGGGSASQVRLPADVSRSDSLSKELDALACAPSKHRPFWPGVLRHASMSPALAASGHFGGSSRPSAVKHKGRSRRSSLEVDPRLASHMRDYAYEDEDDDLGLVPPTPEPQYDQGLVQPLGPPCTLSALGLEVPVTPPPASEVSTTLSSISNTQLRAIFPSQASDGLSITDLTAASNTNNSNSMSQMLCQVTFADIISASLDPRPLQRKQSFVKQISASSIGSGMGINSGSLALVGINSGTSINSGAAGNSGSLANVMAALAATGHASTSEIMPVDHNLMVLGSQQQGTAAAGGQDGAAAKQGASLFSARRALFKLHPATDADRPAGPTSPGGTVHQSSRFRASSTEGSSPALLDSPPRPWGDAEPINTRGGVEAEHSGAPLLSVTTGVGEPHSERDTPVLSGSNAEAALLGLGPQTSTATAAEAAGAAGAEAPLHGLGAAAASVASSGPIASELASPVAAQPGSEPEPFPQASSAKVEVHGPSPSAARVADGADQASGSGTSSTAAVAKRGPGGVPLPPMPAAEPKAAMSLTAPQLSAGLSIAALSSASAVGRSQSLPPHLRPTVQLLLAKLGSLPPAIRAQIAQQLADGTGSSLDGSPRGGDGAAAGTFAAPGAALHLSPPQAMLYPTAGIRSQSGMQAARPGPSAGVPRAGDEAGAGLSSDAHQGQMRAQPQPAVAEGEACPPLTATASGARDGGLVGLNAPDAAAEVAALDSSATPAPSVGLPALQPTAASRTAASAEEAQAQDQLGGGSAPASEEACAEAASQAPAAPEGSFTGQPAAANRDACEVLTEPQSPDARSHIDHRSARGGGDEETARAQAASVERWLKGEEEDDAEGRAGHRLVSHAGEELHPVAGEAAVAVTAMGATLEGGAGLKERPGPADSVPRHNGWALEPAAESQAEAQGGAWPEVESEMQQPMRATGGGRRVPGSVVVDGGGWEAGEEDVLSPLTLQRLTSEREEAMDRLFTLLRQGSQEVAAVGPLHGVRGEGAERGGLEEPGQQPAEEDDQQREQGKEQGEQGGSCEPEREGERPPVESHGEERAELQEGGLQGQGGAARGAQSSSEGGVQVSPSGTQEVREAHAAAVREEAKSWSAVAAAVQPLQPSPPALPGLQGPLGPVDASGRVGSPGGSLADAPTLGSAHAAAFERQTQADGDPPAAAGATLGMVAAAAAVDADWSAATDADAGAETTSATAKEAEDAAPLVSTPPRRPVAGAANFSASASAFAAPAMQQGGSLTSTPLTSDSLPRLLSQAYEASEGLSTASSCMEDDLPVELPLHPAVALREGGYSHGSTLRKMYATTNKRDLGADGHAAQPTASEAHERVTAPSPNADLGADHASVTLAVAPPASVIGSGDALALQEADLRTTLPQNLGEDHAGAVDKVGRPSGQAAAVAVQPDEPAAMLLHGGTDRDAVLEAAAPADFSALPEHQAGMATGDGKVATADVAPSTTEPSQMLEEEAQTAARGTALDPEAAETDQPAAAAALPLTPVGYAVERQQGHTPGPESIVPVAVDGPHFTAKAGGAEGMGTTETSQEAAGAVVAGSPFPSFEAGSSVPAGAVESTESAEPLGSSRGLEWGGATTVLPMSGAEADSTLPATAAAEHTDEMQLSEGLESAGAAAVPPSPSIESAAAAVGADAPSLSASSDSRKVPLPISAASEKVGMPEEGMPEEGSQLGDSITPESRTAARAEQAEDVTCEQAASLPSDGALDAVPAAADTLVGEGAWLGAAAGGASVSQAEAADQALPAAGDGVRRHASPKQLHAVMPSAAGDALPQPSYSAAVERAAAVAHEVGAEGAGAPHDWQPGTDEQLQEERAAVEQASTTSVAAYEQLQHLEESVAPAPAPAPTAATATAVPAQQADAMPPGEGSGLREQLLSCSSVPVTVAELGPFPTETAAAETPTLEVSSGSPAVGATSAVSTPSAVPSATELQPPVPSAVWPRSNGILMADAADVQRSIPVLPPGQTMAAEPETVAGSLPGAGPGSPPAMALFAEALEPQEMQVPLTLPSLPSPRGAANAEQLPLEPPVHRAAASMAAELLEGCEQPMPDWRLPSQAAAAFPKPVPDMPSGAALTVRCPPTAAHLNHADEGLCPQLTHAYALDVPMPDYGVRPLLRQSTASTPVQQQAQNRDLQGFWNRSHLGSGLRLPQIQAAVAASTWASPAVAAQAGMQDGWVPLAAAAQVTAVTASGQAVLLPAVVLLDARAVSSTVYSTSHQSQTPTPTTPSGPVETRMGAAVMGGQGVSPLPHGQNITQAQQQQGQGLGALQGSEHTTGLRGGVAMRSGRAQLASHPINLAGWQDDD